jgi:N-acetylated-alpha-linked acidic dipeptidase
VRLTLEFDWTMVEAHNVIARMEGSEYPDEWVMRGNHHDGWNHGAADPISGLVALMDEAKAVGELAAAGHPPKRTLIYAAWDAEEQGLIGSTEWVEDHAAELDAHLVAYLNTDGNSRGFVRAGGSHTLQALTNAVMEDVTDPQTGVPVSERLRARMRVTGDADVRSAAAAPMLALAPLGSGSDYTPFLQHLGIASLNTSFGGEGPGGSYHTRYDTFAHYTGFRDPGLAYGEVLAELNGRTTLRLANADLLPFEFTGLADNVADYLDEIRELVTDLRTESKRRDRLLEDGSYALALDPESGLAPPPRLPPVPYVNLAPLENAVARLDQAAKAFAALEVDPAGLDTMTRARANRLLFTSERLLTHRDGLPRRPWFRHHVYAPGFYTGYGVKTLPAVREAIEEREFDQVDAQVSHTAEVLNAMADRIEAITARLGS